MCHLVFLSLVGEKATEKIGYKNFDLSHLTLGLMPLCLFIITDSKDRLFLYMR